MTPPTPTGPAVHVSHRVLAVHPDTDPVTALGVMQRHGVRHLPVVRGNLCEGLLTETDLLRTLVVTADAPIGAPMPMVGRLCHRHPPTVPDGAAPAAVAAAILAGGVDAALVVHGGALTGIVTSTDVLTAVAGDVLTAVAGQDG